MVILKLGSSKKHNCLILFFILFLSACNHSNEKKQDNIEKGILPNVEKSAKKEKVVNNSKIDFAPITNENVTEFLTKYGEENPESLIQIDTRLGAIKIKLFKNTPLHRANFIMLIKRKYFDGTVFYRVIDDFMIQGGNSDEWETQEKKVKIGSFKIPSEIEAGHKHLKGALAMARDYTDNPEKLSSPYSFYIVQRGPILPEGIKYIENEKSITYSEAEKKHYLSMGGTPSLDGEHTVFGMVISGLEVVDKIAKTITDDRDWPKEEVYIDAKILE